MSFQTDNLYIRSGSITYEATHTGAFIFNSSIVPTSNNLSLGSNDNSWSNFYVTNLNMGTGGINMGTGSIIYNYSTPTGSFIFNSSLVPSNANLSLGTLEQPWKSLYVSTGTVFIGPTGTLLINDNGLISSTEGFAAPFFQVGAINPGNGLLLFEQNNLLYFTNASGATGAVSVFSISPGTTNDVYYTLPGNVGFGVTGPSQKIDVLGNIRASDTVYATNFTGTNVSVNTITTNTLFFDGTGSIYFGTGTSTGCFITGLNYNTINENHYVYYNNTTKEITQSSPNYFYSYSTGTQAIATASNASTAFFQPVTFNTDPILYHTFQHATGSSVFTGSFKSVVTLEFTYSIQIHSTSNQQETAAAVLYLDGSPIAGSYRSATVVDTTGEYALSNTFLVTIPSGNHWIELKVAATNTNVAVGGIPDIAAPTNSYSSANLCCTRVV